MGTMKSDFLVQGDGSGGVPKLIFIEEPAVDHILGRFDQNTTLVVSSPYYEDAFSKKLKNAHLVVINYPSIENVEKIMRSAYFPMLETVVGIGGGVSTDIAKAVGVKKKLYVYPTILSTNCLSNNRSVLGSGVGSFSYPSGNPKETVVSFHELMSQSPELRQFWTQAGYGDFVAELSAAIERELSAQGCVEDLEKVTQHDPDVWKTIQWVAQLDPTEIYQRPFMQRFAEILHSTSSKVLAAGGNAQRIGSEHDLYKALLTIDPELRSKGAPHGTITGLGTLLVTKVFQNKTSCKTFHSTLRKSFENMKIPLSYEGLERISLSRSKMIAALELLKADPDSDRYLRHYLDENGYTLLDEVFGPQ